MELKEYNEPMYFENEDTFDVKAIINKVFDHWVLILVSLIFALVLAFLVNRSTTPVYNVYTSALVIQPQDMNNAVSEVLYGQDLFGARANLVNETYLFKSFNLIENTLRELDLGVSYFSSGGIRNIELYLNSPITLTIIDRLDGVPYNRLIRVNIVDNQHYRLDFENEGIIKRLKKMLLNGDKDVDIFGDRLFRFGEVLEINGFRMRVDFDRTNNLEHLNNIVLVEIYRYQDLMMRYRNEVEIAPLAPDASILEISMKINNKQKGVNYLNTLVNRYIEGELERKNKTASKTITFINSQILMMGDSLNIVENRLEEFKKSNATLTLSSRGNNYLELGQRYDQSRSQLRLQNQYLLDLENHISKDNLEEIYIPSSIGLNDPSLNRSVQQLVDLQIKVKSVSSGNLNNPIVHSYQQHIELLKGSVLENIRSLTSANNYAIMELNQRMGTLTATLENLPTAEKEFINIQRNYSLSEELYLFLMQKKTEAGIALASNEIDYRVINVARADYNPVSPKPLFNYVLALFGGFLLPIGFILVKEFLNNKITNKDELLRISTIPYLGMVAKSKGKEKLIYNGQASIEVGESFRTIRSNLRYMLGIDADKKGKSFLLTSSVSAEGKSFCSNNLAYVFSNFGKSVVLINADMRKENHYEAFGVENNIGLSDYLAGFKSKDIIIHRSEIPNLYIIPSGGIPPNPSELLINGQFENLLKELKKDFDYIIVDTPPIGILADGLELMRICDLNIYVVRQNYTLKQHIMDANHIYQRIGVKNMALLFNDVDISKREYGGYSKYYNNYKNQSTKASITEKIFQKI